MVRLAALAAVSLLQAGLMWGFITFQLRRMRERGDDGAAAAGGGSGSSPAASTRGKKSMQEKAKARKEQRKRNNEEGGNEDSDLTEVDQNTKKTLRQRK